MVQNQGVSRGPELDTGVVLQGLADDLPAAKAVFKLNWQKLLAAGTVQRHAR